MSTLFANARLSRRSSVSRRKVAKVGSQSDTSVSSLSREFSMHVIIESNRELL